MTVGTGKNRYIRVVPGTGHHNKDEHISEITKAWDKTTAESARSSWDKAYKHAEKNCGHKVNTFSCEGESCTFKKRMKDYYVLTGLVLPFWGIMKDVWRTSLHTNKDMTKVKVVRVVCEDGRRIVGVLVPQKEVQSVCKKISAGVPEPEHMLNLSDRIQQDPLFQVASYA